MPAELVQLVGQPILTPRQPVRDEMEGIDEPPCNFSGERFKPRVGEQVENGGNDTSAFGLRRQRLGHIMLTGFIARLDDRQRQGVAERRHEIA